MGSNSFNYAGIRVPADATLILRGSGDLRINSIQKRGVVLGGSGEEPCGTICVEMTGELSITASSENCFCIGSGRDVRKIDLISGTINLDARGIRTVGVGSIDGHADIAIHPAVKLSVDSVGNEAIAVGSLNGSAKIRSEGDVTIRMEGDKIVGIGNLGSGYSMAVLSGGLDITMRGAHLVCIGSISGRPEVACHPDLAVLFAEGAEVCPIGSLQGDSRAAIAGGIFRITVHSGLPDWCNGRLAISGGMFALDGDVADFHPVSPNGDPLIPVTVDPGQPYDARIASEKGAYTYHAPRAPELTECCVYIPEGTGEG